MSALSELRYDPETAIGNHDYFVVGWDRMPCETFGRVGVGKGKSGGQCYLTSVGKEHGVTKIELGQRMVGGGFIDYYFPYVGTPDGGVGEVFVPYGTPDGTLVVTGGMNGCALEIRRSVKDNALRFYHDKDGKFLLRNYQNEPGQFVLRVEAQRYWSGMAEVKSERNALPAYQMICVKHGARWVVVHSGLLVNGNNVMGTVKSWSPTKVLAVFDE